MNIEQQIFKRSKVLYDKLILYGFIKKNDDYLFSKNIINNSFRVDVIISSLGEVKGKIYDLAFDEEYLNYRIENHPGKFVNSVKEEFESILLDIKKNCFITNLFIYNQTNRIADLIRREYNDLPDFPWEKTPGAGVFRNPINKKWYALIMNINKNKITDGNEDVEAINIKLDENKILKLLKKKGFYKAYHMNKKNWITIILDDTISDKEIMNYIIESHHFTEK